EHWLGYAVGSGRRPRTRFWHSGSAKQRGSNGSWKSERSEQRELGFAHRDLVGNCGANPGAWFLGQLLRFRTQFDESPRAAGTHIHIKPGALRRPGSPRRNHVIFFNSTDRPGSIIEGFEYDCKQSLEYEHHGIQESE